MKKDHEVRALIGSRLKAFRQQLGMSQDDFAELIGVGRYAVMGYENGKSVPTADQLALLVCKGADIQFLITGKRLTLTLEQRASFSEILDAIANVATASNQSPSHVEMVNAAWVLFDLIESDPDRATGLATNRSVIEAILANAMTASS